MSFTCPQILRLSRALKPLPRQQTRHYARAPEDPKTSSNTTWIAISAAIALPAGYFLLSSRSAKTPATPSVVDEAAPRKEAGGSNTMSSKQEGLSNATTDHPYINEPGKPVKGEGEAETAKLKGTVSTTRPQR
ncbi:hypothetical protein BJX70DRAFT_403693 [Aspergillus crustosus]